MTPWGKGALAGAGLPTSPRTQRLTLAFGVALSLVTMYRMVHGGVGGDALLNAAGGGGADGGGGGGGALLRARGTHPRPPAPLGLDTHYGLALGSQGEDVDYDAFRACPATNMRRREHGQWVFSEDPVAGVKRCVLVTRPSGIPAGVAWGPVTSYNWNGDFGYWFDAPGVRRRFVVLLSSVCVGGLGCVVLCCVGYACLRAHVLYCVHGLVGTLIHLRNGCV